MLPSLSSTHGELQVLVPGFTTAAMRFGRGSWFCLNFSFIISKIELIVRHTLKEVKI